MKSALYIEDGVQQIILTPESDIEKQILELAVSNKIKTTMKIGNFNLCAGDYVKYSPVYSCYGQNEIKSLMLVLEKNETGDDEK